MSENVVVKVPKEFTINGLRNFFHGKLEVENYTDNNLMDAFGDFIFRLGLEVKRTASVLENCHVSFDWDIHRGVARLSDEQEQKCSYIYNADNGQKYMSVNAIIANIVHTMNVDSLMENYWMQKTVKF